MVFRERKRNEEKEESRRRVEEREESSRRRGEDQGEPFKGILVFSSDLQHCKLDLESQNTYFSVRDQCHASAKVTREGKATTGTRGEGERRRERRVLEDGGKIFGGKTRLRRDGGAKIERMAGGGCQGFEVEILL